METQWRISVRRTLGLPPRTRSMFLPGLAGSFRFSHQHQRRVSRLLDTMMNSTNSAMQYIHVACRSATNTTGVVGRNRAYLYIHCNLGGDPALDGHDAEVNARLARINELLRVRDGLDRICELTKSEVEEFLGHISTFWCVVWVGSWGCGCLVAWFCYQNPARRCCWAAAPPWVSPLRILKYHYAHGNILMVLHWFFTFLSSNLFLFLHILCLSDTFSILFHYYM